MIELDIMNEDRFKKYNYILERESLKSRVDKRRRRARNELLFIIGAFSLLLGAWLWYHFIFVRTPLYALNRLTSAIEKRDAETALKYIDMDRVIGNMYDELTDDMLRYDAALTDETREQYGAFYDTIKPQLVDGMKLTVTGYLSSREWNLPERGLTKGRQLGIDFERFIERSQMRNTEITKVHDITMKNGAAFVPVTVRDRHTDTKFMLDLMMEQGSDGTFKVARIVNYQEYLDTIAPKQNKGIADYIADTLDIVLEYNDKMAGLCSKFKSIMGRHPGKISGTRVGQLKNLIVNEIMPTIKERQGRLDEVGIPLGAQYLANLRHASTDISIAAWERYLRGIETGSQEDFNAADSLMKQEIEIDLRITDIIKHNTVSQALPEIP